MQLWLAIAGACALIAAVALVVTVLLVNRAISERLYLVLAVPLQATEGSAIADAV